MNWNWFLGLKNVLNFLSLLWTEHVDIQTKFGNVRGYSKISRDGRQYWAFRGLPYAKEPVGDLRFQPPVPINSWNGVWDARDFAAVCSQWNWVLDRLEGKEDCLYLNVFTPTLKVG